MIEQEVIHAGFVKHHLNCRGEEGWSIRPVLHHLTQPDLYYPHDHPFGIRVHVLSGAYTEEVYRVIDGQLYPTQVKRQAGDSFFIPAHRIHRITDIPDGECWTCCLYGPKEREFRFWRDEGGRVEFRVWNEDEWRTT